MEHEVLHKPSGAVAVLNPKAGETIFVERDGMISTSGEGIKLEVGAGGGSLMSAAKRKMLGGEKFLWGRYTATQDKSWIMVGSKFPGDIEVVNIDQHGPMSFQQGSVIAYSSGVAVDVKFAGLNNLASKEGVTLLSCSGSGIVVVGSYGAIQKISLTKYGSAGIIVDTGHLLGVSAGVSAKVELAGTAAAAAASGEGLVVRASGNGSAWVQTRSEKQSFGDLFPERYQNTGRQ